MKTNPNDPAMLEIWKPIEGYEGLYEVSNLGRFKALPKIIVYSNGIAHTYPEIILKTTVSKYNGYVHIGLTNTDKKQKTFRAHRLVAKAFIPNVNNLPEVNHLDYIKTNNCVDNLEWADRFMQNQHSALKPNRKWQSHRKGMSGVKNHKSIPVAKIDVKTNEVVKIYDSGNLAAIDTEKAHQAKITACCKGKRNMHAGYKWQYADALINELNQTES